MRNTIFLFSCFFFVFFLVDSSQSGRLIVDIEVTEEEAETIREAQATFQDFPYQGYRPFGISDTADKEASTCEIFHKPIQFSHDFHIKYACGDLAPTVVAVAEICAVAFNQGELMGFWLLMFGVGDCFD